MANINITPEKIQLIIASLRTIVGKTNRETEKWKSLSLPIAIAKVIVITAIAVAIIFFIVTSKIGPLMIVLGLLMPILTFGIYQLSQTVDRLHKEFNEYSEAVDALVSELHTMSNNITIEDLRDRLSSIIKEHDDVQQVFDDIQRCPITEEDVADTNLTDLLTIDDNVVMPSVSTASYPIEVVKPEDVYDNKADIISVDESKKSNINPETGEDLSIQV